MRTIGSMTLMILVSFAALSCSQTPVAQAEKSLVERLGYDSESRLLILHADDLGIAQPINAAAVEAIESGAISSASIMVPCEGFAQIAEYAAAHPDFDFGLHLTVTRERWPSPQCRPMLPPDEIPSLVAADGLFRLSDFGNEFVASEVEAEIRAQVKRAYEMGVRPTHLDTHQGTLLVNPHLVQSYLRVGQEFGLPVFLPMSALWGETLRQIRSSPWASLIAIDHMTQAGKPASSMEERLSQYRNTISKLRPGVTQFIVHLGFDNEEMRAIAGEEEPWGAAWRQQDHDVITSDSFRSHLADEGIQLISWRELGKLLQGK